MIKYSLPKTQNINVDLSHFPTMWQAVIFRNYGLVKTSVIAEVLGTSEKIIEKSARELGLSEIKYDENWRKRGFITIIKSNWHLLPYGQLIKLLQISEGELAAALYEEDFLYVKLGFSKPEVQRVVYKPLTPAQKKQTEIINEIVRREYVKSTARPFEFFTPESAVYGDYQKNNGDKNQTVKKRILHSYLGGSGNILDLEKNDYFCDELLRRVSALDINGIWVSAILNQLTDIEPVPSADGNRIKRIEIINRLTEKLEKFGMKLYLYLNEPRGLPLDFFKTRPDLLGATEGGYGCMCASLPEVKKWITGAAAQLCESIPKLGGIITITMSENLTNCWSRSYGAVTACPRCAARKPSEVVSEINNLIYSGIKRAESEAEMIAWTWGWSDALNFPLEEAKECIHKTDTGIVIMPTSEDQLEIKFGEIVYKVWDYTISHPGPSERTLQILKAAKQSGHETCAKVQFSNTWECCAVPYIPVYDLIAEHAKKLSDANVDNLMLGWTLGGYPSPNLDLIREWYRGGKIDLNAWYKKTYAGFSDIAAKAVKTASRAFKNFPLTVQMLYYSPVNSGPANNFSLSAEKIPATMVGFPYNDIDTWCAPYGRTIVIKQMKKVTTGLHKACIILDNTDTQPNNPAAKKINELKQVTGAFYCCMASAYNQMRFVDLSEKYNARASKFKTGLMQIIREEEEITRKYYAIASKNALIGYEASNHYFFSQNTLLEKFLNLHRLSQRIEFKE